MQRAHARRLVGRASKSSSSIPGRQAAALAPSPPSATPPCPAPLRPTLQSQLEKLVQKNYYLHQSAKEAYRWGGQRGLPPASPPPLLLRPPQRCARQGQLPLQVAGLRRMRKGCHVGHSGLPCPSLPWPGQATAPHAAHSNVHSDCTIPQCRSATVPPQYLSATPTTTAPSSPPFFPPGPTCWPTTLTRSRTRSTSTPWTWRRWRAALASPRRRGWAGGRAGLGQAENILRAQCVSCNRALGPAGSRPLCVARTVQGGTHMPLDCAWGVSCGGRVPCRAPLQEASSGPSPCPPSLPTPR